MKVFPDTTLKILTGCPCDPDYEHTLYFANETAQRNYFASIAKYTVNDMSYQRAKRGRIRVQYKVENLYDCNYIMFQNTAFGDKWFYAFIDDVTYVNNITSEISYTIDVIQTWLFDIQLQQCFVEREHSVTDEIGDNIVGENLPTGEYTGTGLELLKDGEAAVFSDWVIVVATAVNETGATNPGGFYGRLYSQVEYKTYQATPDGITSLAEYFNKIDLLNKSNIILSVYMCPSSMVAAKTSSPASQYYSRDFTLPAVKPLKRKNGDNVKNKKLMTYPYTYLEVSNLQGTVKDYPFEYFGNAANEEKTFHGFCDTSTSPTFVLMPVNYKGNTNPNADERITLSNFPVCAWAVGDFLNKMSSLLISGALIGLTAGVAGTPAIKGSAVATRAPLDINTGATALENKSLMLVPNKWYSPVGVTPDIPGDAGSPPALSNSQAIVAQMMLNNIMSTGAARVSGGTDAMFNAGWFSICYQQKQIMPEYVDMIDDYFNRYGYATRKIKVPNISSRPHWNYTQTVACKIGGSIPCQDEKLICAVFDHGVTFWKNPSEVGNYSLDNSPV